MLVVIINFDKLMVLLNRFVKLFIVDFLLSIYINCQMFLIKILLILIG